MVYEFVINGRHLKTGDIISTKDGNNSIYTLGFHILGLMIPGTVDHTVMYVGPDGLCVESGMRGVIAFNAATKWNSDAMFKERGLADEFYAASSVFTRNDISTDEEKTIRDFVRAYVLGSVGKPYNFDFLHPDTESRVYCSQLAYLAYKKAGINLNVGTFVIPGFDNIVFPQEIFDNTNLIPETS
jgi:uncharacterized protein YycO